MVAFNVTGYTDVLSVTAQECKDWCLTQIANSRVYQLQPLWLIMISFVCQFVFLLLFTSNDSFVHKAKLEYALLYVSILMQIGFVLFNMAQ